MTVWDIVRIVLTTVFGYINILVFTDWRFSKKKSVLITCIMATISATAIILLSWFAKDFMREQWLLMLFLQLGTIVGFTFLIGKHGGFCTLFSTVAAMVYNQIGAVITLSIASVVSIPWLLYLLYAIVYTALNLCAILFVRKTLLKLMDEKHMNWLTLFLFALFIYVTMLVVVPLPSGQPGQPLHTAAGVMMSLSVVWVAVFMRSELSAFESKKLSAENRRAMELQVMSLETHLAVIENDQKKLMILRHDLKQNFRILSTMLASKDYEGCRELIASLTTATENLEKDATTLRYCSDRFINSVVSTYAQFFEEFHVPFAVEIKLDQLDHELLRELAVVIGNCLDNALAASEKCLSEKEAAPDVRLRLFPAGEQTFLEISNAYIGSVSLHPTTGTPTTEERGHGFGSLSVKTFAQKHGATVSYLVNSGIFTVRIII